MESRINRSSRQWLIVLLLLVTGFFTHTIHARTIRLACVDCYSSASFYAYAAKEFALAGDTVEWIHIRTHDYNSSYLSHIAAFPAGTEFRSVNPEDSVAMDAEAAYLAARGVEFVVGGMDEGTYYACELNHNQRLRKPDNDLTSRDLRRKKDVMGESSGMGIPTHKLETVAKAMDFITRLAQNEVVVKFNAGAAGAKMDFLSTSDTGMLRQVLQNRIDTNIVGPFGRHDDLLVQPRIVGREFFINVFTVNGVTFITGISEYFRIKWGDKSLYFVDTFLSLNSWEARQLLPLTAQVLKRHGHRNGPAHVEFILDEITGQWFLLENNARVAGAGVPWLERAVYGTSHLDLQMMRLINPELLKKRLGTLMSYDPDRPELGLQGTARRRIQGGAIFVVPTPMAGDLTAEGLASVQAHESFFSMPQNYLLKPEPVKRTIDQYSAAFVQHLYGSRSVMRAGVQNTIDLLRSGKLVRFSQDDLACSQTLAEAGQLYKILSDNVAAVNWEGVP